MCGAIAACFVSSVAATLPPDRSGIKECELLLVYYSY